MSSDLQSPSSVRGTLRRLHCHKLDVNILLGSKNIYTKSPNTLQVTWSSQWKDHSSVEFDHASGRSNNATLVNACEVIFVL